MFASWLLLRDTPDNFSYQFSRSDCSHNNPTKQKKDRKRWGLISLAKNPSYQNTDFGSFMNPLFTQKKQWPIRKLFIQGCVARFMINENMMRIEEKKSEIRAGCKGPEACNKGP